MAIIFGGRPSTGIILPLLCAADLFAVSYYHRHANWKQIIKLLPFAFLGIILATFVGRNINDHTFKLIIGLVIIISIVLMFVQDFKKEKMEVPKKVWYSGVFGLSGGFTTMIGNAAGPVMALYLQSMKLPKTVFIGTSAWFFLILNYSKLPLQIIVWHNINLHSIFFDLILLPAIAVGAFLGVYLVKKLPEKGYRIFVLVSTAISASLLLF